MKIAAIIVFLLLLPYLINGQTFDTIPYLEGNLMIIEQSENERMNRLVEETGGIIFRANYKVIDSSGLVIMESIFYELDENSTIEIKSKGGEKTWEQILLKNASLSK